MNVGRSVSDDSRIQRLVHEIRLLKQKFSRKGQTVNESACGVLADWACFRRICGIRAAERDSGPPRN